MAREALAEPVGPVVLADPGVRVELVAQVVLAAPVVPVVLAVLVALEHVLVEVELEHARAAVEQERVLAEAAPEHGPVAVPPRIKSVIAVHHRGRVPRLVAVEDLAVVVETTRDPAATEAGIAWAAAV